MRSGSLLHEELPVARYVVSLSPTEQTQAWRTLQLLPVRPFSLLLSRSLSRRQALTQREPPQLVIL